MANSSTTATTPRLLQIGAEWQTEVAGGANRYTYGLAHEFDRLGIEQDWIVIGDDPRGPSPRCNVMGAATSQQRLPTRLAAVRRAVVERAADCDVMTSHFALYARAALHAGRRLPHVVHFHGPWAEESRAEGGSRLTCWAKRRVELTVYRSAARLITLSSAFADILINTYGVDADRVHVIPGGIDPDAWNSTLCRHDARERLGLPTDRPVIVCVRRLAQRMGLDVLVDAMTIVRQSVPDVLLAIVGKGPQATALEEQIRDRDLINHVRLLGFVPDCDLPDLYRAADLSVVPSQSLEGFGLVTLESLAAGTPVLVTPVGGLPEAVGPLSPELLLASTRKESIASGMIAALASPAALPTASACREYVRAHFAWPVIARRIVDVYREVT